MTHILTIFTVALFTMFPLGITAIAGEDGEKVKLYLKQVFNEDGLYLKQLPGISDETDARVGSLKIRLKVLSDFQTMSLHLDHTEVVRSLYSISTNPDHIAGNGDTGIVMYARHMATAADIPGRLERALS